MNARNLGMASLVVLVVLFIGLNAVAERVLRGARIDLTEHRLYTLSEGTRNILRDLDEDISFTLFYSEDLVAGQPQLQSYGKRVREILEEYRRASGGRIEIEVVNPEPFSEGEERAAAAGVRGLAMPGGQGSLYLGLLAVNSTDGRELVPFFDPREERFLEYTLSKLVYSLDNPERKRVAVMSSLAIDGGAPMPGQPPARPWQIMTELRSLFDVETLEPTVSEIPDATDVLLLIHPKSLSEPTLRAIDRYVIGGGRAIVLVDPVCEADLPPGAQQNPLAAMQADRSSELNTLLEAWGASVDPAQVAADRRLAMRGQGQGGQIVPYVQYLAAQGAQINQEDAIGSRISLMQFAMSGAIEPIEGAGTTLTPLVQTTDESMLLEAQRVSFFPNPSELLAGFTPRGAPLTLAARLSGTARSAFAGETSEAAEGPVAPSTAVDGEQGEINVIVIADVDMLADQMWVQEVNVGGMSLGYRRLSDNGSFLVNAVEQLAGSTDLIAVRGRGTFSRPFTLVEEIREEAESKYLSRQQALETTRRETEQRIAELQRTAPDQSGLILSSEQRAEIERFREQLIATNRELRDVRYNLSKDVERLGWRLKMINIGAAPLAVLLAAIGLAGFRARRRSAHRTALAARGAA